MRIREEERKEKERIHRQRKMMEEKNTHRMQENMVETEINNIVEQLNKQEKSPKAGSNKEDSKRGSKIGS